MPIRLNYITPPFFGGGSDRPRPGRLIQFA